MYSIGDLVMLNDEYEFRKIVGIQILIYIGYRGNVSTDYILYLGNGMWASSSKVSVHKKSRYPKR